MKQRLEVVETKNGRWRWVLRDDDRKGKNGMPLILAQCRPAMFASEAEARDDFTDVTMAFAGLVKAPEEPEPEKPHVLRDPLLTAMLGAVTATAVIYGLTYLL